MKANLLTKPSSHPKPFALNSFSFIPNFIFVVVGIATYGYSINKLRKSQGRILIRLVDRETSRTSFQVIKDLRNIFSAGFWQLTAKIFGHNLRSAYNPNKGEDRMIEYIINRIENKKK